MYWSPETIQSLSSFDQVKQFIMAFGSFIEQVTKKPSYYFYDMPHNGASILSPELSTLSDHFTTTIVDISPYGSRLLIIYPSRDEYSICIYSWLSSSEKKTRSGWIPIGDNHSSKSLSSCPWYWNFPYIRFGSFNYLLNESFQHRYIENSSTTQYPCK